MTPRSIMPRLTVCSLLLLSTGCVFGERSTALTYPPGRKVRVQHAIEAATHQPPLITLGEIRDERTEPRIGEIRNAWGWKTADLQASTDVAAWVRDALRYELMRSGYEVIDGPSLDGVLDIDGAVVKAFAIGENAYDSDVIIEIQLDRPGREPQTSRYFGRATTAMHVGVTGTNWDQSLALALSDALRELMVDVKRLAPRRASVPTP